MEIGIDDVARIVSLIYEAAYDVTQWPVLTSNLRDMFGASTACLARVGPGLEPTDTINANGDPAFAMKYLDEFAGQPNEFADAVALVPVGEIYRDQFLMGADGLRRTRFWNDWMAPQDMYGGLACKLLASSQSFWFFDVQRGRNQHDFSSTDLKSFSLFAPHLRRALEIGQQFRTTQSMSRAFAHPPFGTVVVNGHLRIVTMNAAAEALLIDPASPVSASNGRLRMADSRAAVRIRELVENACSIRGGLMPGTGGDLLLSSPGRTGEAPRTLSVSIGPLTSKDIGIPAEPCAIIVFRDMALELPAGFEDHIRALFRLTAREANLASALASGTSLKDAANAAEIRFSTARSHLERIFLKTGTNQQSQLVALLKSTQPLNRES
jgi:DNA-binding CsgD family transcriptional regulator